MEKTWIEISMPAPAPWVDLVCEVFWELGSCGVLVEERKLDTFVPPDPDENESPILSIRGYFPGEGKDLDALKKGIEIGMRDLSRFIPNWDPPALNIGLLEDKAWAEGWKQFFQPFRVGKRLVVCPTWEEINTTHRDVVLRLDPGMAFGTGCHATTRLCLEALAAVFDHAPIPKTVLDVGTGSGILAMAAAGLGAAEVLATDIDAAACEIARRNIDLNRLSSRIAVRCQILEKVAGRFDVIVANILAEELVRLAPHFLRLLSNQGRLILSGILEEKEALVSACFSAFPMMTFSHVLKREEWCCLMYEKG